MILLGIIGALLVSYFDAGERQSTVLNNTLPTTK